MPEGLAAHRQHLPKPADLAHRPATRFPHTSRLADPLSDQCHLG